MTKETKPTFTLRLDADQQTKVKELSDRFGVGEAQVIRWGVDALIKYVERHGGKLHLPIDFNAIWKNVVETAPSEVIGMRNSPRKPNTNYRASMVDSAVFAEPETNYGSAKKKEA